jgi:hypothetical protein
MKKQTKIQKPRMNTVVFSTRKGRYITKGQAKEIVERIKTLLNNKDVKKIAEIEFRDRRSYNVYNINFNGKPQKDFETFTFYTEYKNTSAQEVAEAIADKKGAFNKAKRILHLNGVLDECRCWTNENPYRKVVIEALDIIQRVTKNALKIEWS